MERKSLQVWLPTYLHDELDRIAKRERRSKGAQVAVLLEQAISERQNVDNGGTQIDMDALRDPSLAERVR